MACRTGLACGLTLTRSGASRNANHSAVISDTIEALDAWWPPTFTPERFSRTRLAWWTMLVASHSTRRWTRSSVCRSISGWATTATRWRLRLGAVAAIMVRRGDRGRHARAPAHGRLGVRVRRPLSRLGGALLRAPAGAALDRGPGGALRAARPGGRAARLGRRRAGDRQRGAVGDLRGVRGAVRGLRLRGSEPSRRARAARALPLARAARAQAAPHDAGVRPRRRPLPAVLRRGGGARADPAHPRRHERARRRRAGGPGAADRPRAADPARPDRRPPPADAGRAGARRLAVAPRGGGDGAAQEQRLPRHLRLEVPVPARRRAA